MSHSPQPEQGRKRKRGQQDSDEDLSKMRMALNCIGTLKAALVRIQEPDIAQLLLDLEQILKEAENPKTTFSAVKSDDLVQAGVIQGYLVFRQEKIEELLQLMGANVKVEIVDLHSRIRKIHSYLNMDYERGSRTILNAVLIALASITSMGCSNVTIFQEMRIPQTLEVKITHPTSGYELWLSGKVDYAVIEYEDVKDYKERLLGPGGSNAGVFELAKGHLFLVEGKRQDGRSLSTYIPEAVGQAIALLKSTKSSEIRFCLSDGHGWIFLILKSENDLLVYYESVLQFLESENDTTLRNIIQIACEWLKPTMADLYELLVKG